MADSTKILNGSFKGIPILIDASSIEGGRKSVVKQFPSRDTQSVEDLGLLPRKYTLDIIISDNTEHDYFGYRTHLLAALESGTPGELIHPLYGRIDDVVEINYSLNESFGLFGDTVVVVNFEVNNNTGIPQESLGTGITQIAELNATVALAVSEDIASNFEVTTSFAGNFSAAVDKVTAIIDKANEATSFIGEAAQTLDSFSAEIGQLSADVNSLVSSPIALADAIIGLFESVNGLYASVSATFETFLGFFDFGSDDISINQTTAGLTEQQLNNDILNGAVASESLSYAYLASVQIDYATTAEIDAVLIVLDDQYDKVLISGVSQDVKDAITEMRIDVINTFDLIRINTPQVITVNTQVTSARLLAFNYYGNDDNGEVIVDLNNFSDVSFIEGDVQVVTA